MPRKKIKKNINKKIKVVNFGEGAFDSFTIKERVKESIKYHKPNLIIIYSGHNDYTNSYGTVIAPKLYLIENDFLLEKIFKLLCPQKNKPYDFKALLRFRYEIIATTRQNNIPTIFITPIGNLEIESIAADPTDCSFFTQGLKESDYNKRIQLLTMAKDSHIFPADTMRAKSRLNNFLRSLNSPTISVFDLENKLKKEKFMFNYESFMDAMHFKDTMHEKIAKCLYEFMLQKGLFEN